MSQQTRSTKESNFSVKPQSPIESSPTDEAIHPHIYRYQHLKLFLSPISNLRNYTHFLLKSTPKLKKTVFLKLSPYLLSSLLLSSQ